MNPIWPGATIGILGGGQLGRMMALEARRMGYRVAVLDSDDDSPAVQVADIHVAGKLDDVDAARRLAALSDVVTLETEHVPSELLEDIASLTLVRPSASVLYTVQDRLRQRQFLQAHGLPQVRYAAIDTADDFAQAEGHVGFPAVLKTRRDGYDGKGQVRVDFPADLPGAWDALRRAPAILECFVHFEKEVSTLLARFVDGEISFYAVAENDHRRHLLHTSHVPANVPPAMVEQAEAIAATIASQLGHVGMMAVELFVTRTGELLVNEIAPRTHNSGHYTFGACATSQFEQHVRAVCGLAPGDPTQLGPAVMLNLLGDLWADGPPDWDSVLRERTARLHLYGKRRASAGRKMGHVLVLDDSLERASATAQRIARELESSG